MARERTLRVGALNIKTTPEKAATYAGLMRRAHANGEAVRFWGSRYGTVGALSEHKYGDGELYQVGRVDTYTELDPDRPWYNKSAKKQADEDEVERQVKLPENLRPEHVEVSFIFFPRHHRLFFELGHIGHSPARKLFQGLLNLRGVRQNEGPVEVFVEQDASELDRVYGLHELQSLEIEVTRPNPDDLGSFERLLMERLRGQNAKKQTLTLEAEEGKSLSPDDFIQKMAAVALSDGAVQARGREHAGGRLVTISTQDRPLAAATSYDPSVESLSSRMLSFTEELLGRIISRRK